jgi:hypothetical protein
MLSENIKTLIVAGDLFNKESQNYPEFDKFYKNPEYRNGGIKF